MQVFGALLLWHSRQMTASKPRLAQKWRKEGKTGWVQSQFVLLICSHTHVHARTIFTHHSHERGAMRKQQVNRQHKAVTLKRHLLWEIRDHCCLVLAAEVAHAGAHHLIHQQQIARQHVPATIHNTLRLHARGQQKTLLTRC